MKKLLFSILMILSLTVGCITITTPSPTAPPPGPSPSPAPGPSPSPVPAPSVQADLVIIDIGRMGNTVNYVIKNEGTATAGPSTAALFIDGVLKATDAVGPLSAGASVTLGFSYSYSCAGLSDLVSVQADRNNAVDEGLGESNNVYQETWGCLAVPAPGLGTLVLEPDLVVVDIIRNGSNFSCLIKNQGTGNAGISVARLYVNNDFKVQTAVPAISVGVTKTVNFVYQWPCIVNNHVDQIRVVADGANQVTESNEGNNEKTEVALCIVKPDLVILNFRNVLNTIMYTIKNQGPTVAGPSMARLSIGDAIASLDPVGPLAAGESKDLTFSNYSWHCSGASDVLKVEADALNSVAENNEDNNSRTEIWDCP